MPVAYPELVSGGGVSKSHKCKGLVKVGASKGVKKIMIGGDFWATRNPPGYATACHRKRSSAQLGGEVYMERHLRTAEQDDNWGM